MTVMGARIGLRGAPIGWVDTTGTVQLDDRRAPIAWWVAADDRWHDPCRSPSLRQRRIDGTPVVETKLAVPGGDVVQTVLAVADQGGCLVVRFENRSPTAVVIAVPAEGVCTTAATAGTSPQGIDLPATVRAYPLAHGGEITFAWSLRRRRWRSRPTIDARTLSSVDQVVHGWVSASERASRVPADTPRLTMARSEVLLAEPRELDELLRRDPALGIVAVAERVRMGDPAAPWVEQCADSIRRVAKRPAASAWSTRAFSLAAYLLLQANEHDAARDVTELWRRATVGDAPKNESDGSTPMAHAVHTTLAEATAALASVEDRLVRPVDPDRLHLLPNGVTPWLGSSLEAHGLHAGPLHRLSFAVRWHGKNAALLWEIDGPPGLRLLAPNVDPNFATSDAQGETLLRVEA